MINHFRNLLQRERGSVLVLFAFVFTSLLALTGLAIDGGTLFLTKTHLQKTANAAALSGAQELFGESDRVSAVVHHILEEHHEQNSLKTLDIQQDQKVTVALHREVSLSFLKLLGFEKAPVEASATASLAAMGRATGAAPLGIDDAISLQFYQQYKLKVDQTGVESGTFGVLALAGVGAKTYEESLRSGYGGEVAVGNIIPTQTGNIAGHTRSVINEKVNACSSHPADVEHRNCPRILLIPVYQPHNHTSNQLKEVKVTGFAYFYIQEPMFSNDTAITGMFIKKTGPGVGAPDASNKGAYTIKLTE